MFALPYAGGSASIYRDWSEKLKPVLDVYPIEYAGHAGRFNEDYFKSIEEAAEDISETIIKQHQGDYVLYGHSMGCSVALETTFVLKRKNAVLPKAIIVAANRPPHLRDKGVQLGEMSKSELLKFIISRGQFDEEILESEEFLEIVSDILYSDIKILYKYKRHFEEGTLDIPILALAGDADDDTPASDMQEWGNYTTGNFDFHMFHGDHFFAFKGNQDFIQYLQQYVKSL